jgi:hypothetical protein
VYEGGRGFLEQIIEARNVDTGGEVRDTPYSVARLNEACKPRSTPKTVESHDN